jgi:NADPH:quinone reductase-like Zn-dependent oxidoreductase
MRSYKMQLTGDGPVFELREEPVPRPGPRQVLVRLRAAALNRGEFIRGLGKAGAAAWKPAGGEGAGTVQAVGGEVSQFKPGDAVMGRCAGAFSDYALMEAIETIAMPPNLSWEEASGIPLAFLVTFDMLVLQGHLKAGEWLLVTGVSSGVGVASLQLAKALGARVIGTSGSRDKLDRLAPLGLDLPICTRAGDFAPAVLQATEGRGAALVVNTVGGSVFAETLRALAFEGRHATVGYVDGQLHADLDLALLHSKRLTLFGVSNQQRTAQQRAAALPRFVAEVMPFFAGGRIRPLIDQVFDFADLKMAEARMRADVHAGKIILRISA